MADGEEVAEILAGSNSGSDEDSAEGLNAAYDEYTEAVKSGDKAAGLKALKAFVQMVDDDD